MKKKILYLCHRIPYPPNKGDKIRSFNEIKYLSKKYTIDLITLADDSNDLIHRQKLKKYCRKIKIFPLNPKIAKLKGLLSLLSGQSITQGYFYQKQFQETYNKWTKENSYNTVLCFSSPMAEYIFKSSQKPKPKIIMDFCDLDSDKWKQYAENTNFPLNLIYKLEAKRLLDFEIKINKAFHKSIFISDKEKDLFLEYYPNAQNIQVIPNGVDHQFFHQDIMQPTKKIHNPMIMFAGAMDYYANIDGITWFVEKIYPSIKKSIPQVKFYIVGSNPSPAIKSLEKDPSIIVTGFVKDIREYYKSADLCIIPLRIARGVQNKILEALSMAKNVISTSTALQGITQDTTGILQIEDDPVKFAQKTIDLLQNNKEKHLGQNARKFIRQHYDWETNIKTLCALVST